jgi:cysteine desulfurase/selenocysteine lyase
MSETMKTADVLEGANSMLAFDVERVRADFPILHQEIYGRPLVYLDNGASAQCPRQVIDGMSEVYETIYANVHRGVHYLSQRSTDSYEGAREKVARFVNAATSDEIVFARGTTDAINLVADSFGRAFLEPGDEVVISHMEHHSNIVPWQLLRDRTGIVLKVIPIDDSGNLMMEAYQELLGPRTKLVAITHVANSIGTIVAVKEVARLAHAVGAKVLVDGAQAVPHLQVDVQDLGVDFYAFSSHKLYGPTGIGVLWGRLDLLNALPPYQGGGDMIQRVTLEKSEFKAAPHRFEAGTPAIVEAVGLGAAIDYVTGLGLDNIAAHEHGILAYVTAKLSAIEGLEIVGTAEDKAAIVSFTMFNAHAHDIGTILDRAGVAVRAGHHCAEPTMDRFGLAATARASFGLYNTREEVDLLVEGLMLVKEFFG